MKKTSIILSFLLLVTAVIANAGTPKRMTITAHTGAYGTPDNTMEFVDVALGKMPDIMEIDIRCRPNGTLAMSHDAIKTDADGEDIWKVFEKVKGTSIRINLDIKQTEALKPLRALITKYRMGKQVFMTGLEEDDIPYARKDCRGIKYYLNCKPDPARIEDEAYRKELLALLKSTGSIGVNCNFKYANQTLSDLLHENGYLLSVWTVNKKADAERMIAIGVDNITSRSPETVEEALAGSLLKDNSIFVNDYFRAVSAKQNKVYRDLKKRILNSYRNPATSG